MSYKVSSRSVAVFALRLLVAYFVLRISINVDVIAITGIYFR